MSVHSLDMLLQDDEEPTGDQFTPDGGYIPRIFFMGTCTEEQTINSSCCCLCVKVQFIVSVSRFGWECSEKALQRKGQPKIQILLLKC